jgi:hypothetical protein
MGRTGSAMLRKRITRPFRACQAALEVQLQRTGLPSAVLRAAGPAVADKLLSRLCAWQKFRSESEGRMVSAFHFFVHLRTH